MLALGSIGTVTAWAHNRSSLLDFLVARNVIGLSAAAGHLIGAKERATADLSGLLEGSHRASSSPPSATATHCWRSRLAWVPGSTGRARRTA